jgi:tRNA:m4X modification enzyme
MNALDAAQRFALGKKCKRLIDMGRLLWLREKGMQAKLVEYIADTVSPENKVLLAKRVWTILGYYQEARFSWCH